MLILCLFIVKILFLYWAVNAFKDFRDLLAERGWMEPSERMKNKQEQEQISSASKMMY